MLLGINHTILTLCNFAQKVQNCLDKITDQPPDLLKDSKTNKANYRSSHQKL